MFVSGIANSLDLSSGVKGEMSREKINQLKEVGQQRREMFGLQKQGAQNQNEQMNMQIKQLQQQLIQQDMKMVQDESYRYIDNYLTTPTEDGTLDDRYLNSAYVENPLLNQSMSQKLGLKQITEVKNDGTGNLIFKDSMSGKEKQVPLEMFLPSIGYFSKRDSVHNQKAEEAFKKNKQIWETKKLQAETMKALRPDEVKPSEQLAMNKLQVSNIKDVPFKDKDNWNKALESGEGTFNVNGEEVDVLKVAKEVESDAKTIGANTNKYITELPAALNTIEKVKSQLENMTDEEYNILTNAGSYINRYLGSGDEKDKAALDQKLQKLNSSARVALLDYLTMKTGAAFSIPELGEYKDMLFDPAKTREANIATTSGMLDAARNTTSSVLESIKNSHPYTYLTKKQMLAPKNKTSYSAKTYKFGNQEFKEGATMVVPKGPHQGKTAKLVNGKWVVTNENTK